MVSILGIDLAPLSPGAIMNSIQYPFKTQIEGFFHGLWPPQNIPAWFEGKIKLVQDEVNLIPGRISSWIAGLRTEASKRSGKTWDNIKGKLYGYAIQQKDKGVGWLKTNPNTTLKMGAGLVLPALLTILGSKIYMRG
jgi:hypothetical protein